MEKRTKGSSKIYQEGIYFQCDSSNEQSREEYCKKIVNEVKRSNLTWYFPVEMFYAVKQKYGSISVNDLVNGARYCKDEDFPKFFGLCLNHLKQNCCSFVQLYEIQYCLWQGLLSSQLESQLKKEMMDLVTKTPKWRENVKQHPLEFIRVYKQHSFSEDSESFNISSKDLNKKDIESFFEFFLFEAKKYWLKTSGLYSIANRVLVEGDPLLEAMEYLSEGDGERFVDIKMLSMMKTIGILEFYLNWLDAEDIELSESERLMAQIV